MWSISKFAYKVMSVFIILMLTSGTFSASAQGPTAIGQNQTVAADAPPLGANLIQDPSFEASYGSTTGPWFQNPADTICIDWSGLCNVNGAGYHSGGGWVGFFETDNSFGDVYQYVRFPQCGAQLQFYLYIGEYFGPGQPYGMNNYFGAFIDGNEVFSAHGSDVASYQPYTLVSLDVSQFADGGVHTVEFYGAATENFLWFNLDDVSLIATNTKNCAQVTPTFGQTTQATYAIPQNQGDRQSYPINDGPVLASSTQPFVAAERVISFSDAAKTKMSHFSELMGLPQGLVSNTYAFPVYDNFNFDSQLRFGNVSNSNATVRVYIGQDEISSYLGSCQIIPAMAYPFTLLPRKSMRLSCKGVNGQLNAGPVRVVSNANIVASMRVLYNNGSSVSSFSEMMGLPVSQWDTTYWMPWYNKVNLDSQLRIGNVGNANAHIHVFIGAHEVNNGITCTPTPALAYPYTLAPKESLRLTCAGVNDGPVKIVSDVSIVTSLRVAHFNGTKWNDFSELMGLPDGQKSTSYVFPWYNNRDLDSQLRFANISSSTAQVHVYIGGVEMAGSPFTLLKGASTRQSFAGINNGPVVILSNVNIVASLRILINNGSDGLSFSELMGLPGGLITTNYVLPWYNNLDINTQLRFGVP